jgi:Na+-driven multidrug efflux pump
MPLVATLTQLAVNLAGDVTFIYHLRMSIAGAAWATVGAQYMGCSVLLYALRFSKV